jgi:hypothetical protein
MENFLTWVGMCWEGKLMRDVLAMELRCSQGKGKMEIFKLT